MRILFTNISFGFRSGTELFLADLAAQLISRGHECVLFTTLRGPAMSGSLGGILPVIDDPARLPWRPDIIHGQHALETLRAIECFPDVPALYVCHDATSWFDSPPPPPLVRICVAVDRYCRQRVVRETALAEKDIPIIGNTADTTVFLPPPGRRPERPARALVFHSHLPGGAGFIETIREVCHRREISLDVTGAGTDTFTENPQDLLPRYDLVFTKARCAIEAMACGCGVILSGSEGFGPLVRPVLFDELREYNFGRSLLQMEHRAQWLEDQISLFRADEVEAVCQMTRERCATSVAAEQFERLYATVRDQPVPGEVPRQIILPYINSLLPHLKKPNLYQHSGSEAPPETAAASPKPAGPITEPRRLSRRLKGFSTRVRDSIIRKSIRRTPFPVIGGAPRSGTTLLRLMLDAHPNLAIPPETNWLAHFSQVPKIRECTTGEFVRMLKNDPATRSNWPDLHVEENDLLARLPRQDFFSFADGIRMMLRSYARHHGKALFGEKSPGNSRCFSAIEALLPEARFLHIVRDGRAVCASWRRQGFAPPGGLIGCVLAWQNWVVQGREEGAKCRHYLEIRFEDLVADPERQLKTICAFLDLPWSARMLEHHLTAGRRLAEHEPLYDDEGTLLRSRDQRLALHAASAFPPKIEKLDEWKAILSDDEQKIVNALMATPSA